MKWHKLSNCRWAAASGNVAYLVMKMANGFEARRISDWRMGSLGVYSSLVNAKARCEAERIMG